LSKQGLLFKIRNSSAVSDMKLSNYHEQQDVVQLEIGLDKLEALFNKGELCAADVRCLNGTSKRCIRNLCLTMCARRMQCNIVDADIYECCKQYTVKLHADSSLPESRDMSLRFNR
jgi:hypothetical protein